MEETAHLQANADWSREAGLGLHFHRIVKSFDGTQALDDVSMEVREGEIVALLGENGAGKSTLIKILGGIHHADSGRITLDGAPYHHHAPRFGQTQPVAFIHQDLGLIDWMSVAENMALAPGFARRAGLIHWSRVRKLAADALARLNCDIDPDSRVQDLGRAEKSLVAIARALAVDCRFLVLDEPTASLPAEEVGQLLAMLRQLKGQGVGMIYISHRLSDVFEIADRAVVLRDGRLVADRPIGETDSGQLMRDIVGRTAQKTSKRPVSEKGRALATIRNLRCAKAGPLSFDIAAGEVLGLVGLRGAGHEGVARTIFGVEPRSGEIAIDDVRYDLSHLRRAIEAGIGLVARDRLREAVAPGLNIRENIFLNPQIYGHDWWGPMARSGETVRARAVGQLVTLLPNDPDLPVEALSGGNQQKLALGRWLESDRRLLLCEDPTAGIDIGAKAEIHKLLNETAAKGNSILIVSNDFEEVASICHRALVFTAGRITEEIEGDALTVETLIAAASAHQPAMRGA
ncbi:sugar ABC transporter ATP-binding protein [Paracoccus saliphilus]|uniref:Monosaccharide ABC transporter ATP-binding protein, CUT2 family n=1 Tax=Paracoccus saliphilus TaxID=405559 RepID=A0AA45W468_9RHOB|nr:sugar ABC transporter ATP-binding protein [Paracoccus saliphilus]WCR03964.1 sugar ABC transporter ATP-binding protein [Paracoccus saliphilus]SIS83195.1 monosaccharide ABC transporter ATP-binding protein, CUT2 family [Paracoccus saliphilus]